MEKTLLIILRKSNKICQNIDKGNFFKGKIAMNKKYLVLALLCFTHFIFSIMNTPSGLCPNEQKKLCLNALKTFLKTTEKRRDKAYKQQQAALAVLLSDTPYAYAREYQKAYDHCLAHSANQDNAQDYYCVFSRYLSPELRQRTCYDKIYRPATEKYIIKEYMAKNIQAMMQCINQLDNCDNANSCLKIMPNIPFPSTTIDATQEEIDIRDKSHQEATKRLEKIIRNSSRTSIEFFHLG